MNYKHHVLESPFGWIGLLGSDKGLRRLSLRPGFQEALGGLGPELDESDNEPHGFDAEAAWLERFFRGEGDNCDDIELDLTDSPPFFCGGLAGLPANSTRRDQELRLAGRRGRQPRGGPRRGTGDGAEPVGAGDTLPSGYRQRREPGRLQRWRGRA